MDNNHKRQSFYDHSGEAETSCDHSADILSAFELAWAADIPLCIQQFWRNIHLKTCFLWRREVKKKQKTDKKGGKEVIE